MQPEPTGNTAHLVYFFIIIYLPQILRLMITETIIQTRFPESLCSLRIYICVYVCVYK